MNWQKLYAWTFDPEGHYEIVDRLTEQFGGKSDRYYQTAMAFTRICESTCGSDDNIIDNWQIIHRNATKLETRQLISEYIANLKERIKTLNSITSV